MQGRLRDQQLSVSIATECAHCGEPLHLVVDSELRFRVEEEGARPLVFEPEVDWASFSGRNIIHDY